MTQDKDRSRSLAPCPSSDGVPTLRVTSSAHVPGVRPVATKALRSEQASASADAVVWSLLSRRGRGEDLLGRIGSGFGFDQRDVVLRIMCAQRRKNALGNSIPLVLA